MKEAVTKKYNLLATLYDYIWPRYIAETIAASMEPFRLSENRHVVDIGCGTGPLEQAILGASPTTHITALDISPKMLSLAQKKLGAHPQIDWKVGDFLDLPL